MLSSLLPELGVEILDDGRIEVKTLDTELFDTGMVVEALEDDRPGASMMLRGLKEFDALV